MYTHAITRLPCPNFAAGLTTATLGLPDYELALQQHQTYVTTLGSLGLAVTVLESEPDYPDAHFVEDTAVITPEIAVITRPGALARRGEEESIAPVLAQHRTLAHIQAPGTVDGGDVLVMGKHCLIGLSQRTNEAGANQLRDILLGYGYNCAILPVGEGLHLKSSINYLGQERVLVTQDFVDLEILAGFEKVIAPDEEVYAANTLWINDTLLTPHGFPKTHALLMDAGLPVIEMPASEMEKMDGGLTCLSLRFSSSLS